MKHKLPKPKLQNLSKQNLSKQLIQVQQTDVKLIDQKCHIQQVLCHKIFRVKKKIWFSQQKNTIIPRGHRNTHSNNINKQPRKMNTEWFDDGQNQDVIAISISHKTLMKELLYDLTDQNQNNETQTIETKITEFIEATNSTNRRDINKLIDPATKLFRVDRRDFFPSYQQLCILSDDPNGYSDQLDFYKEFYKLRAFAVANKETFHHSSPSLYLRALVKLELKPNQSFLQIGSGTGYFQTFVNHIIGPNGISHGIELRPTCVEFAKLACARHNLKHNDNIAQPIFFLGNGFQISKVNIKYDRIYVAGGVAKEDQEYFTSLLKPGGILVGPFGSSFLKLIKPMDRYDENFNNDGKIKISEEIICNVIFKDLERSTKTMVCCNEALPRDFVLIKYIFSNHTYLDAPKRFRSATIAILILSKRGMLNKDVFLYVLSFCGLDWFNLTQCELLQRKVMNLVKENEMYRAQLENLRYSSF